MPTHSTRVYSLTLSAIGVACAVVVACSTEDSAAAPRGANAALVSGPATPPPAQELIEAMAAFARGLRDNDRDAILRAFSQDALWNAINTKSETMRPSRVSYEKLAEALNTEGALRTSLVGEGEGSLRTYVTGAHAKDWIPLNQYQFAPPAVAQGSVWIAWRPEAARWVIDTIAWPMR